MVNLFRKSGIGDWLGQVYKADKVLFVVLALFFILTIGSNLIRLQTSPFFIWNMYSSPMRDEHIYPYYQIRFNDSGVVNLRHTWNEPLKTLLYDPLRTYLRVRDQHLDSFQVYLQSHWQTGHPALAGLTDGLYLTQADLDKYPAWLKSYLSSVTGLPIRDIYVLKKQVRFDTNGEPVEISSDTVLHIP